MYTGTIGDYFWIEWREENEDLLLIHLLAWFASCFTGLYALNTSYDSGLLHPTEANIQAGWSILGQYALSPPATTAILKPFFAMEFSEWYFFKQIPDQLPTGAFCNWTGMSLAHAHDVAFHHDLEADLSRCQPEIVIGEGRFLYIVYHPCYHQRLVSALPESATGGESR